MRRIFFSLAAAGIALAQSAKVDHYTTQDLTAIQDKLAASGAGFKAQDLAKYQGHYTMVAHREVTGSSEVHEHEADFLFIEAGEGAILIGGKLVNAHTEKPGELRGTSIEGGEKIRYVPGDIFHIPAGIPHQMLVEKAKPVTYFVVKVAGQ